MNELQQGLVDIIARHFGMDESQVVPEFVLGYDSDGIVQIFVRLYGRALQVLELEGCTVGELLNQLA